MIGLKHQPPTPHSPELKFDLPQRVSEPNRDKQREELAKESFSFLTKPSLDTNGAKLSSFGVVFIMLKSALDAVFLIFLWAFEKAGGIHSAVTVEMASSSVRLLK